MRFALSPEGRGATGEYNSGNHKKDCSGRDHTLQHRQGRQMDPMTMYEWTYTTEDHRFPPDVIRAE